MFLFNDWLIGLPVKGLIGIFKKIAEMAEAELTDESKIREELLLLENAYESGQISEEEYQEREARLVERLNMAREQAGE